MDLYQQIFFTTLAISFGILHLLLYLSNNKFMSNLYFSIFLILYAISLFFDFQRLIDIQSESNNLFLRIHHAVMPYRSIFGLLFLYSIFNIKLSRQFWIITFGLVVTGLLATINFNYFNFFLLFIFAYMIEALRVIYKAILQKKNGAWIIASGFALLFFLSLYDMFLDFNLFEPILNITNGYQFGFGFLIISTSIYLAHDFANMNKRILEQERQFQNAEFQRRLLLEEDKRKSKELEDAKDLQLSMLPKNISGIDKFDICFDMKPATEVGGDYYDYLITKDKTLIITIGDATGHGMKAGIMVSIIKSLFISHIQKKDFLDFFNMCSQTIRKMRLGNLYMTMLLLKIKNKKLIASSAGIPPFLIYRADKRTIDEIVIKGAPLGAVDFFPYQIIETELKTGDIVLLMSDGFPELLNEQNEMLEYIQIKKMLKEISEMQSDKIVQHLFKNADEWRKQKKQTDDITFIVIKVK